MSEYSNHYLLTSPNVQTGGEMDAFFSMMRDRNGNLFRVADADPYFLQVSYVYPPYNNIDSRYTGGNKIVLVARFKTGLDNPYANAPVNRAQEWSSLNPNRRVWTNTQGDVRPVPFRPEAEQARLDQLAADLLNQALANAQADFINTLTEEWLRLFVMGLLIYYLNEDYEAAVANVENEMIQLSENLPWYEKQETSPESVPMVIKFVPLLDGVTRQKAALDFATNHCSVLKRAAIGEQVNIGDTICVFPKDPSSEQAIYDLVERHNDRGNAPYLAAATLDDYCARKAFECEKNDPEYFGTDQVIPAGFPY